MCIIAERAIPSNLFLGRFGCWSSRLSYLHTDGPQALCLGFLCGFLAGCFLIKLPNIGSARNSQAHENQGPIHAYMLQKVSLAGEQHKGVFTSS